MVLWPQTYVAPNSGGIIPAWKAIEPRQHLRADSYLLVTQPDHAALAGALAAGFVSPQFPRLHPGIVEAIAVHDAGWALFAEEAGPAAAPAQDAQGKPLSFVEIAPADFIRAWAASIQRAEQVCADGGIIVSLHFSSLARFRLDAACDPPSDTARLQRFLEDEEQRRQRLRAHTSASLPELESLLQVLQFCDLLSLYLCCGATDDVEFPQDFGFGRVRLTRHDTGARLDPSPFRAVDCGSTQGLRVAVPATMFSRSRGRAAAKDLSFVLW